MLASMNTTSSQLPVCVHCGTPRPADETLCPKCGKPWIDTSIEGPAVSEDTVPDVVVPVVASAEVPDAENSEADTPPAQDEDEGDDVDEEGDDDAVPVVPLIPPPPSLTPDDTGEFSFDEWTEPEDKPRSAAFWLIPAGFAAVAIASLAFIFLSGDSTATSTTIAASETTVPTDTTTATADTTTTTSASTTTAAEVFPGPSDWPAVGDPIELVDLTLKADGIGPIDIGTPIADAAGALTASLGEATEAGIDGLCPPDESYWLQFGQLTAIFDGHDSSATFVSYKYDEPTGSEIELGLMTPSGIAIGDTVDDLISTYTQYTISNEVIDSKDYFRLSDGGELLLWGPLSSADPEGIIEGIYSPSACDPSA